VLLIVDFLEEIGISLREIHKSPEEIPISLFYLYISLREIPISSREIPIFASVFSKGDRKTANAQSN